MKLNPLLLVTGGGVLAISKPAPTTPLPSHLTQPSASSSTPTMTLNLANPTVANLFPQSLNNALRNLCRGKNNGDNSAFLLHLPLVEKPQDVLRTTGTTEPVKAVLIFANVLSMAAMDVLAFVDISNTTSSSTPDDRPDSQEQRGEALQIAIAGSALGCSPDKGRVEVRAREEPGESHGSTEIGSKRKQRHRRRAVQNNDEEKRGGSSGGGGHDDDDGSYGGGGGGGGAAVTSKSTRPSAANGLWLFFLLLILTVSLSLATPSLRSTDDPGKKKRKSKGGSRSPRWLFFLLLLILFISTTSASAAPASAALTSGTDFAPQPTKSPIPTASGPEPTPGQIDFFGAKEEEGA